MVDQARDIFDIIAEEEIDAFDSAEAEDNAIANIKKQLDDVLKKFDSTRRTVEGNKFKDELKTFIKEELSKIKPIQNVIEKTIEKKIIEPEYIHVKPKIIEAPPAPPQIIREVRVEVEAKDTKKYVEVSKYLDLLVRFAKLEEKLKETRRMAESPIIVDHGGSGVIGIPPPEPNPDGYVLKVFKGKAVWGQGAGSSSSDVYTTSNVTTTRNLDPTTSTIDDLYNVVASLIQSLQGAGIIQ